MLTAAQKSATMQRVNHFVEVANKTYNITMTSPSVLFDLRGTCGGTATGDFQLRFNAGLMVDNWDHYMNHTIPHEVAHLAAFHMHGIETKWSRSGKRQRVQHGNSWKGIMHKFGCEPNRTHAMDVTKVARPRAKFAYECSHCGQEVAAGPNHHRRAQAGANIRHKGCPRTSGLVYKNIELGKVTWTEAAQGKQAPVKKTANKQPAAGTKISTALAAYKAAIASNPEITRQEMITVLADAMQVDRLAAAGYYQNCKKKAA
jgi:SprT protein